MTRTRYPATHRAPLALLLLLGLACPVRPALAEPLPEAGTSTAPIDVAVLASEIARLRAELDEERAARLLAEDERLDAGGADAEEIGGLTGSEIVRFYGFVDMGIQRLFVPDESYYKSFTGSSATTFVLGNVNLYLDAQPVDSWRAMVEVRLTNYPRGADLSLADPTGNEYSYESATVFDVNSPNGGWGRLAWSGIILERSYVEWTGLEWLGFRVGFFPTPFGIWNVDHGSPTLISLMTPQMIVTELFPTQQLGINAFGRLHFLPVELGYHLYLTNGRTPGNLDLTDDKAVGGRIFASIADPFPLALGVSFFHGRSVGQVKRIVSFDPFVLDREFVVNYLENGIAFDLSGDFGPLRLRTEVLVVRKEYAPGQRDPSFARPGSFSPDQTIFNGYLLLAYQLPWLGIEPYAYAEYSRYAQGFGPATFTPSLGFNVHFTPSTMLKAQGAKYFFETYDGAESHNDVALLAARLVVAF